MPRLMSVALTTEQVRNQTKTVTRRLGWRMLKPGDIITLCAKVQGRKKGEPLDRICDVLIVRTRREPLDWVREIRSPFMDTEPGLEGFPDMTAVEFIEFFCTHMKCEPDTEVTRIEWRYL